ncbi:hypothetical protein [Nonomuraea gerenzanensis]|uniref:Uncharacterized protein n=1 Tax=Nonomuraea gerenzanensis TaxID=93944 RepID=A0A1M4E5A2_9ACTN|nr:hypothetical protein [Nonomuraea gerenzanensis]UBU16146.1 hypothetical protein LCN96_14370 [Nonomuraea gerenzanensis]SBO93954.1 hypothetical protein BN4615_P3470 [Nonomuraea gerenzanensis]
MEVGFNELYAACQPIVYGDLVRGRQALTALLPEAWRRGPRWGLAMIHAMLADLHGRLGDVPGGIEHFRAAVDLGWNDCLSIWSDPGFAALARSPHFAAVHARVWISPADLEELRWLRAEAAAISQELSWIAAENIGRVDHRSTDVFHCPLPTRTPDGGGVPAARMSLAIMQRVGLDLVAASDISRISGQIAVDAIGTSSYAQEDLWRSAQLADSRAAARRASAEARAFRPTPGLSTVPVPATSLQRF